MSNPNPFVPKGSLLEQQSKRRSHLKIAVSCVLAVGIVGLVAMLIQGCKRDTSNDNPLPTDQETNQVTTSQDTNNPPPVDTNAPVNAGSMASNVPPPVVVAPVVAPAPVETPAPEASGTEYIVVSGDTLGRIAKKNGVSLKALEAANPDVNPKHLKVKQKLVIPAGGSSVAEAPATSADTSADTGTETTYTVKSGDTLHRIARKFGTSVKAIEAENNLSTTKIKVGEKLKIPAKAEAAAPVAAPAPVAPAPEPSAAPVSTVPAPGPSAPTAPSGT
jgi:LysM repeat protein